MNAAEDLQVLRKDRDFSVKPEAGDTPHARLVRLLSSPHTHIRELASTLLSSLCHGNRKDVVWLDRKSHNLRSAARIVYYAGYGNAAGILAAQGISAPPPSQTDSDSDDE